MGSVNIPVLAGKVSMLAVIGRNILYCEKAQKIEENKTASNITFLREENMETAKTKRCEI